MSHFLPHLQTNNSPLFVFMFALIHPQFCARMETLSEGKVRTQSNSLTKIAITYTSINRDISCPTWLESWIGPLALRSASWGAVEKACCSWYLGYSKMANSQSWVYWDILYSLWNKESQLKYYSCSRVTRVAQLDRACPLQKWKFTFFSFRSKILNATNLSVMQSTF